MKRILTIIFVGYLLAACDGGRPAETEIRHTGSVVISDVLSNQRVNAFAEDADGHIWIATFRGLNQYNVHEYHQFFCTSDTLGLPDNEINDIYCSRSGRLWVATADGVAYRTDAGDFRRIPLPGSDLNVRHILESKDGSMLFSNSETLFRYDEEAEELRTVIPGYNAFGLPGEAWEGDNLWSLTNRTRLSCYDSHDLSLTAQVPIPFTAYHICNAGYGELWLSGVGHLAIYDARARAWKALPEAILREPRIMDGDVDFLFSVDDNTLLLNVIGTGMFCWQRINGRLLYQNDPGFPYDIPDSDIRSIFRDSRQNLWIGTTDQGYATSYHHKDGFNSNKHLTAQFAGKTVVSLAVDHEKRLWISTQRDGLFVWDPADERIRKVELGHIVADARIGYLRCDQVFCDAEGELWLLFTGKSQVVRCRFENGVLYRLDAFSCYNPGSIAQDGTGVIWIGHMGQDVIRYDKKAPGAKAVPFGGGNDRTSIAAILPIDDQRILLATNNMPFLWLDPRTGVSTPVDLYLKEKDELIRRSMMVPVDLYRDSAGDVWIGTVADGLLCHIHEKQDVVPVPGTPCLDICAVQEDRQGNIWVSTMSGLGRYDRTVGQFVNYFSADGIGGNQFSSRAACRLDDGTLVFGGTHGLTVFNPLDMQERRSVPLVFEDLKVHNQLVEPGEGQPIDRMLSQKPTVIIHHDQNAFSISFAALDYSEHERSHYYY